MLKKEKKERTNHKNLKKIKVFIEFLDGEGPSKLKQEECIKNRNIINTLRRQWIHQEKYLQ